MQLYNKRDRINIILKPTNNCNLRCLYCFHQEFGYANNAISFECIKKLFTLLAQRFCTISILWHGGEPTCVGLDCFKQYIEIQKNIKKNYDVEFINTIQTNLTNINIEWMRFFKNNDFSIGTSFDGLSNGETRFNTDILLKNRKICLDNGYDVGAICVISSKNIHNLIENYNWFKANNFSVNFNPLITNNKDDVLYVDVDIYTNNIIELFKYWLNDDQCSIHVNPYENLLYAFFKREFRVCTFGSCLSHWVCVEPNGDFFPCDKSFNRQYCLGNVADIMDFDDIYKSDEFLSLIEQSVIRRKTCIDNCKWFQYCHGGCNHDAFIGGDISKNNHYYCKIYKSLFEFMESNQALCERKMELIY